MKCATKGLILAITVLLSCLTFILLTEQYKFPQKEGHLRIEVDLTRILAETNEKFLSIGLDTTFMKCQFHKLNESAWKQLEERTSYLSPGFLRLGGTAADRVIFTLGEKLKNSVWNNKNCSLHVSPYDFFEITDKDWIKINHFAKNSNLNFIYDLNVLLRDSNGWNSSNAEILLRVSKENKFLMDFQLGNEPNSFYHIFNVTVPGSELGKDFNHLRRLLNSFIIYKNSKLIGPDITRPKHLETESLEYLKEFLSKVDTIDAVSWHQYYLNGKTAHLEDFINPKTFNVLHRQIDAVTNIVRNYSSDLPIWISETSSAYGGGAPGLSDRFVATFLWLDKLGISAASGISVVIRQSLLQGNYALLDEELSPNPDFWVSFLYKNLVGNKVLKVIYDKKNGGDKVRFYSHCSIWKESEKKRDVEQIVVFALNFSNKTEKVIVSGINVRYPVYSFILSPENGNLTSKTIYLNEKKLTYSKDKIKDLLKVPRKVKFPLDLPEYSIVFWILQSMFTNVCD